MRYSLKTFLLVVAIAPIVLALIFLWLKQMLAGSGGFYPAG